MKRKGEHSAPTSERSWLKKRRRLVDKAVADGPRPVTSEAKDALKLSKDLWSEKQTKEIKLQRQRDHVNSLWSASRSCSCSVLKPWNQEVKIHENSGIFKWECLKLGDKNILGDKNHPKEIPLAGLIFWGQKGHLILRDTQMQPSTEEWKPCKMVYYRSRTCSCNDSWSSIKKRRKRWERLISRIVQRVLVPVQT